MSASEEERKKEEKEKGEKEKVETSNYFERKGCEVDEINEE